MFSLSKFHLGFFLRFGLRFGSLLFFTLIAIAGFSYAHPAAAATITWDGGGITSSWSDPGNWSTNTNPTSTDVAVFDSTSTKSADINFNTTVASVKLLSGYTGTVTASPGILTTTDSVIVNSGTLDAGTANMNIGSVLFIAGGTFKVGSGTTLVGSAYTVGSGDVLLSTGTLNGGSGTLQISKDFDVVAGTFTAGTGTVYLDTNSATGGQATWDFPTSLTFNNLVLRPASLGMTIASGDTLVVNKDLTIDNSWSGVMKSANPASPNTIQVKGNVYQEGGSGTKQSDVIIDLVNNTTVQTYTLGFDPNYPNTVAPTLLLNNAADANDKYIVTGDPILGGFYTFRNLTLAPTFSGTMQLTNADGGIGIDNLNQSAGTLDLNAVDFIIFMGNMTLSGGTLIAPSDLDSDDPDNSLVTWNVNSNLVLNNVKFNSDHGLTIASGDTLTVNDDVDFLEGTVNGGSTAIEIKGDMWTVGNFDGGTAGIKFTGSAAQLIEVDGATHGKFDGDITVAKTATTTLTQVGPVVMDASGQDLVLTSGRFALAGNNLTVNGTGSLFTLNAAGNLVLQGNETITRNAGQPTFAAGSVVRYTGDGDGAADTYTITSFLPAYGNAGVSIESIDAADTFQLGANLSARDLIVWTGTFDVSASNYSVTFQRAFTNSATFKERSGTVIAGGAENATVTMASGSKFYNFTMNDPDGSLFFQNGPMTVRGLITLQGSSGHLLSVFGLTSSDTHIDFQGTEDWDYLNVSHINNTNASAVSCVNCTNGGSNTNITF